MLALFAAMFILAMIFFFYYLFIFEKSPKEISWVKRIIILALATICLVMTYPSLLAQTQARTTYAGYNVIGTSGTTSVAAQNITTTYDYKLSSGVFNIYSPFYISMLAIILVLWILLLVNWFKQAALEAIGEE